MVWPYYLKRRTGPVQQFLLETIALCPPLAERLSEARLISEVEATGNYSYCSTRSHGRNFLLLGDAYAFIDPVFSSGVMFAMQSAFAAPRPSTTACAPVKCSGVAAAVRPLRPARSAAILVVHLST